jgi:hypothetical protein
MKGRQGLYVALQSSKLGRDPPRNGTRNIGKSGVQACSTTSMTIDTKAIHIYETLLEKSPQQQQSGTNEPNAVHITLVHCAV